VLYNPVSVSFARRKVFTVILLTRPISTVEQPILHATFAAAAAAAAAVASHIEADIVFLTDVPDGTIFLSLT
jgi:hypothetical protein